MPFHRTRKTLFKLLWRLVYTGRVMEVRRVPYAVGWRQANEAWSLYEPHIVTRQHGFDPKSLADRRIRLFKK